MFERFALNLLTLGNEIFERFALNLLTFDDAILALLVVLPILLSADILARSALAKFAPLVLAKFLNE